MDEKKVREAIEYQKRMIEEFQERMKIMESCDDIRFDADKCVCREKIEMCKTIIEALEKQLSKKITDTIINNFIHGEFEESACPVCEEPLDIGKYCSNCGQKIDWSET